MLKLLCVCYLISELLKLATSSTVPCIVSCPRLLQAVLAVLNGLVLSLAVSAVPNSLVLQLSLLNSLLLHSIRRYHPFAMFSAGWPMRPSRVAAVQTWSPLSASEKRLPCCPARSPERRMCNLCKASGRWHKKKTKSRDR